jgi:hypothetical protein
MPDRGNIVCPELFNKIQILYALRVLRGEIFLNK